MREQMQLMREEQNNKIKEVLSEEQFAEYQAWQEERRARRGQGGPGNGN
jgi:Spy/CpxP family protein refolding chaperone